MGIIAPWYLRESQIDVYTFLFEHKNPVLEASRRWGKTTTVLIYVLEYLIRNPGKTWRWCEPLKDQARKIVVPELEKIQNHAHPSDRFNFYRTDSVYANNRGSKLYLLGVCEDKGESARGSYADGITADEKGSWREAGYILNEVLRPQLLTTDGQLIEMSTPPRDLGHLWYSDKNRAVRDGRFKQKIIYDNESLTDEQIKEAMESVGGEQSPAWQREFLCNPIADPESLVMPEFNDSLHVSDVGDRPQFFDNYTSLDLGFNDFTAGLFGYYDFEKATVVIEDEMLLRGKNSEEIANTAKAIEKRLWGDKKPTLRVSDNDLQQLYDFLTLHSYNITPTRKDDKQSAINRVRTMFSENRIKISPKCIQLIYQLKTGMWATSKKDYQRGSITGHLDAIDALIYLVRNIDQNKNPFPAMLGLSNQTHFIPKSLQNSKESETLRSIFNIKRS